MGLQNGYGSDSIKFTVRSSTGLLARRLRLAYTAIAAIAAIALQPFASCITQKLSHVWQHCICIVTCSKSDEGWTHQHSRSFCRTSRGFCRPSRGNVWHYTIKTPTMQP